MTDLISRQTAIDALNKRWGIGTCILGDDIADESAKVLNALPSAQPEIMRCKDCRYNNDCEIQYNAQSGDEFFCGCAERKDNG